jgi:DNA-binding response OmpR family regulator
VEPPLAGRSILVIEDNAIIAMDVVQGLQAAGASVSKARTLSDALRKVECPNLSAAVLERWCKSTGHGLSSTSYRRKLVTDGIGKAAYRGVA